MFRNTIVMALMSTLAGCSSAGVDMEEPTAADGGFDDVESTVELEIDSPDASTYWSSVSVTGHGPANGTLIYTSSGGGQFTEPLGATGDFCVDVVLNADVNNSIKFEAVNQSGAYSEPIIVEVRQAGEPPEGEANPTPNPGFTNIALGARIDAMSVGIDDDGDVSALVDGDSSGFVTVRNSVLNSDWMVIELTDRLPIEQIHIETTEDCPMEHFRVLLSDDAQSADPVFNGFNYPPGWVNIAEITDGVFDQVIEPNLGEPRARRMAIEFLSGDCSNIIETGRHRIREIEVWARGDGAPGEPGTDHGAPSCSSL